MSENKDDLPTESAEAAPVNPADSESQATETPAAETPSSETEEAIAQPAEPSAPVEDAAPAEGSVPVEASAPAEGAAPAEATGADGETGKGETGKGETGKGETGKGETGKGEAASTEPAKPASRKPRYPHLLRAFRTQRPVEGTVVGVIKGGYEVRLGKARAFCPHSQIDRHRQDDAESQVGKAYTFRITQIRRGGEDIVVSRRAILEQGREEEAKAVRATLIEGAVTQGHVVSVAEFGAFVDLGAGVLGLVHISELSHSRVGTVGEAVKLGDAVAVRVLKLKESGRVSLSIRKAVEDPWAGIQSKFEVGKCYPGSVTRLADFGAFVELAAGVEALAPASEFPPKASGWADGLEVGSSDSWMVLSVDKRARRMSLALPAGSEKPLGAPEVGQEFTGKVQRIERYGIFVWLGPGCVGLMPRSMTGAGEGSDLRRAFHVGDDIELSVVTVEQGGRRIRLCKKGVEPEPEEDNTPMAPAERKPDEPQGNFGTSLADKLRAALGQNES